ncbi:MAG: ATP-binding protein [Myxococcota bacterium]
MRLGIRAQILLAITAVLVLALAPLFLAIANLARASLTQSWQRQARSLGRAVTGHVHEARGHRAPEALPPLLEAQLGEGVAAIGVYDRRGRLQQQATETSVPTALPDVVAPDRGSMVAPDEGALLVITPGAQGPVAALLYLDPDRVPVGPLVRLTAFYIGLLGLTLLVFAYFALTRIVVAPVVRLQVAAGRVASGARTLSVPRTGGRELVDLAESLRAMTDALRAEEENLKRKVEELERSEAALRRAQNTVVRTERLASVGRLAAGLAHEIGNPIAAILSFQELLLDGDLDPEPREFVVRMKRETERVHRVLRDLLDFARPTIRNEEAPRSASVADVVDVVVALVRPQRALDDVVLSVAVEAHLPAVAMHPDRLEQVLLNLVLNAADVVPRPGGRIAIDARSAPQGGVRLSVEDDGGGVDPEVRDRIFEPFVTTKDVGQGTGLGLAVCRGLVEAVNGTIDIEDGPEGARFVVTLPGASAA